jgi:hypothetical protein
MSERVLKPNYSTFAFLLFLHNHNRIPFGYMEHICFVTDILELLFQLCFAVCLFLFSWFLLHLPFYLLSLISQTVSQYIFGYTIRNNQVI